MNPVDHSSEHGCDTEDACSEASLNIECAPQNSSDHPRVSVMSASRRLCWGSVTNALPPIVRKGIALIPLFGAIFLLIISSFIIREELEQHSLLAIWENVTGLSPVIILLAIACVMLNYWVMTGYDLLAIHYIKGALPYRKTALVSAISYAISNTVGATFLSGGALRYRFYKSWGLTAEQIAQVIAFCNLSFWLGMLTMGGVLLLANPLELETMLPMPIQSIQSLGLFAVSIVGAYLLVSVVMRRSLNIGWIRVPRLSFPIAIAQLGLTVTDWTIAAATLYILLNPTSLKTLPYVIGGYVVAQLAGVLSSIPGGIGVFETVMILLLSSVTPMLDLLGALVAFRLFHHIGPMILAVVVLIGYELRQLVKNKRSSMY